MAYDFDHSITPGATHGDLTELSLAAHYDIGGRPNGGYVLSAIARAMAQRVAHPHPVTITAHYLRPSEAGAGELAAEVVRTGRTFSTVTGAFAQDGRTRVQAIATFGDLATFSGPTRLLDGPPELAAPDECTDRRDETRGPLLTFAQHVSILVDPSRSYAPGHELEVRAWVGFPDGRPLDVWCLPLFCDACPPTAFGAMDEPAWVPTVELTVHVRNAPVGTRLRARFRTRFLERGLCEEDGELWDERDVLVAQSRQLAMVLPAGG